MRYVIFIVFAYFLHFNFYFIALLLITLQSAKTRFREQLPGVFDAQAANLDDINEIMGLTAQDDDDDEEMDL